ncbi:MAG: DUF459 domain-containing protein [Solidesulfovibrio sp. DCME]|uniref:SGNH/GDSL hydrolase family protein n=1 Tax=Solidesulfovibrio sp. DCME TaxID=3447380 RepID=UPI003D0C4B7F
MPNAPLLPPVRPARRLLTALAVAASLCAATGPAFGGPAPEPDLAANEALRALVAGRGSQETPAGTPAGHAVRLAVSPFAVRLAVDKAAVHPGSAPVAVREDRHLGGPAQPLRLVALAPAQPQALRPMPEPAARALAAGSASPAGPPAKPFPVAEAPPTAALVTEATAQATAVTAPSAQVLPVAKASLRAAPATVAVTTATTPAKPRPEVTVKNTTPPAPFAPATPVSAPAARAATPGGSILVAGDSLSLFLADALRPMLAGRPGVHFAAKGKVSSGLARPDFFNWEREMAAAATASRPDSVVIMIATNDNQTLTRPDGVKVAFGRPGWEAEYGRRVRRLVDLARLGNPRARIYWIGAPVMANPRLSADVAAINAVIAREIAALPGCRFVDVRRTLADAGGHYAKALPAPGGPRPVRTADGVHLTPYGATLLAHAALAAMSPTVASLEKP